MWSASFFSTTSVRKKKKGGGKKIRADFYTRRVFQQQTVTSFTATFYLAVVCLPPKFFHVAVWMWASLLFCTIQLLAVLKREGSFHHIVYFTLLWFSSRKMLVSITVGGSLCLCLWSYQTRYDFYLFHPSKTYYFCAVYKLQHLCIMQSHCTELSILISSLQVTCLWHALLKVSSICI